MVILSATGQPDLQLEVKEIANGVMLVGPTASAAKPATTTTASSTSHK